LEIHGVSPGLTTITCTFPYLPSNDTFGFDIPEFLRTKEHVQWLRRHVETGGPNDYWTFFDQLTPGQKCRFLRERRAITFNRVDGDDPFKLRGVTVNRTHDFDPISDDAMTRIINGERPETDFHTWKSSDCTWVEGAFYWAIARHTYAGWPPRKASAGAQPALVSSS
jgi:hypothetical protein